MSIDMVRMRMKLDERDAKIAQLRAALEEIEQVGDGYGGRGTTGDGHARCREIARKALAKEGE